MSLTQEEISERLQYLDHISLVGIEERGRHGMLDHERQDGQLFLVDADIYLDLQGAGASDRIEDTVDYSRVSALISRIITGSPCDLLEKVAAQIAEETLELENVQAVRICLHKPEAPLGLEKQDVKVTIWRGLENLLPEEEEPLEETAPLSLAEIAAEGAAEPGDTSPEEADNPLEQAPTSPRQVVVAMGGNLGEVSATFREVVAQLSQTSGIGVVEVSPLVRTAPVLSEHQEEQPDYLNAVVILSTMLSPLALLEVLQNLEDEHGRVRSERWGARTLDLDIIDYQGVTSKDERLILPHPRASQRAFVLLPWSLVAPAAELTGVGEVVVLADYAPDRDGIKEIYPDWIDNNHPLTEAGTGSIPLPRWSAISRPAVPPRVLDDARELHPTGEVSQVDKLSSPLPAAAEEAPSVQGPPLPLPPTSSAQPTPPAPSLPLPHLGNDRPQATVILDEEPEEVFEKQERIATKPKKKSWWQRIKAFFVGEKADPEQFMPDFEQADNLTENAVGSEHSWQALPNSPVPALPSSPTQTESAKTGATEEKNPAAAQNTAPEAGTTNETGKANDSQQEDAGDASQVMEATEGASNEQPTETMKRGSGRHAGRLVTGPIPAPEDSPQPLPLDIEAGKVNDSSDARGEDESRVERKSILRPTTTGAIPVVKPETDRTAQPTAVFDPLADSE
ncbi:MAG: 2-amino-4-hydroxy-6-hydroxymethyldihydropteridine diphosphokinase [Varibaculum cambriense]|uniref:2-amino-4-hydroxy-6- hydroxymethyldihydropteridine diphosphokinase n=1 Tax=Varibaculum cambriense TaxID=184870 RepID=UPI00290DE8C9|nr:2-amino-4-hydroxy-6-hydroxymethyldihydropteridine diphosphokinase [Varibaculum cambriense]MDU4944978.1 2-amino-4-hydroxy-6-hydroxymethyldihydropteridine diphosphokinase [Varibaculum cambriense]